MEVDTIHVVKRIVALLVDSFQPENVSPSQQVRERGGVVGEKSYYKSFLGISQLQYYMYYSL
jgi:hypothetical protein